MPFSSSKHVFWLKDAVILAYIINSLYQQKYFSRLHLFLHINKDAIHNQRYISNLQILEAVSLEEECLMGHPRDSWENLVQFCFPSYSFCVTSAKLKALCGSVPPV